MTNTNTMNDEVKSKELNKTTEVLEDAKENNEQTSQVQTSQPIQVEIVSTENKTQIPPPTSEMDQLRKEFFDTYDLINRKTKDLLDLFPKPPGKLMKSWLWFQKHAFTSVVFIVLGIALGIGIEKIMNYNDMIRAINLQRMEFKGDLFDIQPSSIKKYYEHGEKSITSLIQKSEVKEPESEPTETKTVETKTTDKKGK